MCQRISVAIRAIATRYIKYIPFRNTKNSKKIKTSYPGQKVDSNKFYNLIFFIQAQNVRKCPIFHWSFETHVCYIMHTDFSKKCKGSRSQMC